MLSVESLVLSVYGLWLMVCALQCRFGVHGLVFRVSGLVLNVGGSASMVLGLGGTFWGSGCMVKGKIFRVYIWSLWFMVRAYGLVLRFGV